MRRRRPYDGICVACRARLELIDRQVTKLDAKQNKITPRHGPIKKLEWTWASWCSGKDPAMLKQVKAGDKFKLDAERTNGQYIVTKNRKGEMNGGANRVG